MYRGKFIQTKQGMSAFYKMLLVNDICATARIPRDTPDAELYFLGKRGNTYVLRPSSVITLSGKGLEPYISGKPYEIFSEAGESCGYIYEKKKQGIFKGYVYDQIIFNGTNYTVYTVSVPKEGDKYAIYASDGQEYQVALVEKPQIVYNRLDEYFWMSLYEEDIELIGLYLLYRDYMMNAPHRMETVAESREISFGKTWNRELWGKYNDQFKYL
jgi:hypothetical protein